MMPSAARETPGNRIRRIGMMTLEVLADENTDVDSRNSATSHKSVGSHSFNPSALSALRILFSMLKAFISNPCCFGSFSEAQSMIT